MIKEKLYDVKLSLEELEILDGKVNSEAQKVVDIAKSESEFGFKLPIMNEVLRKSLEIGELTWRYKQIRSCSYCDKGYDYHTYPRSGRYHSKGDKNFDKPKYYSGIKFNEGCVTVLGSGDMCSDCEKEYNAIHILIDYILENDLKIQIQKNDYKDTKYIKDDIRICYHCEEEMQESKMGRNTTMMGDGTYPCSCPKCGAESLPFGRSHKTTKKFAMIINPEYCTEIQEFKRLVKEHNSNCEKEDALRFVKSKIRGGYKYSVEETKWNNGYREVISFDLSKREYKVGYFYKDKADKYEEILIDNGYKLTNI